MTLTPYQQQYERQALDAKRWLSSARNLLASSDLLWQSVSADLGGQYNWAQSDGGHHADITQRATSSSEPYLRDASAYLMIAGFAVENALKAIRVKQAGPQVLETAKSGTMRLSRVVKTHDLVHLATTASVSLSDDETALLERLGAFLTWAGRYPVSATDGGQAVVQNIWESDRDAIHALFARLEAAFQHV